jgi:tRNA pseudouridine13 synthase
LLQGREKDASGEYIEAEALRKIRQIWKESKGDPELTLEAFPRNSNIMRRERTVLQGLKRYGSNKPLDALRTLSNSIRMFWITAYQSYIWNKMATERLRRLGTKVVIGDLYLDPTSKEVMVVSNPDTVTLYDLVLPLPGFNVIYPTNIVGQLYFDILKQDGVEFRKDAISEATAKGAYRHLFVKPNRCEAVCEKNTDEGLDATFRFQLPKGAFATMFLREVMASILAR